MSHQEPERMGGAKEAFVNKAACLMPLYCPPEYDAKRKWARPIVVVLIAFILFEAAVRGLSEVNFPPAAVSLNDPPQPLFPLFGVLAVSYFFGGETAAWVATTIGAILSWFFFVDPPWLGQPDPGGVLWAFAYTAVLVVVSFCLTRRRSR